jgi:hypothetical protein
MRSGPHNWAQTAVGTVFSLYSALVLFLLLRVKVARPERAKWGTVFFTIVDFAFVSALAVLDVRFTGQYQGAINMASLAMIRYENGFRTASITSFIARAMTIAAPCWNLAAS